MLRSATRFFPVLAVALLVGAIVFGVVRYYGQENLDPTIKEAVEHANCENSDDQDLCRFLATWSVIQNYALNATENKADQSVNYNLANKGDSFHLTVSGEQPRQTIAHNGTLYFLVGEKWYEQQLNEGDDKNSYRESDNLNFLKLDNSKNFTLAGEEKCLQANCLRYEVNGLDNDATVWFDKAQYRLQRVLIRGENGYSYNAIVNYNELPEVMPPNNSEKIADGQHILPGGTQVSAATTNTPGAADLPATGDSGNQEEYKQWLKQRQQ